MPHPEQSTEEMAMPREHQAGRCRDKEWMGSEVPLLQTTCPQNLRVAGIAPAKGLEPSARTPEARSTRRQGNTLATFVVLATLALLATPARGRPACSAFSSSELLLSSSVGLPRRSKEVVTMVRRSTSTAAPPPESIRIACAVSGNPRQGPLGSGARRNPILVPRLSRCASGVVCGAVGDRNNGSDDGSLFDDEDNEQRQQQDNKDDEDDSSMFSFAGVEDEIQSRSAAKAAAPGTGVGDGAGSESGWLPRFFPPRLNGEDGDAIQPLVELPLDGILLQVFPALLIGVVGLFLMIAVQVESNSFDGMVGEEGGAVVVTDLRDTAATEQP